MEELPFFAGLQIIDADLASKGIDRIYSRGGQKADFDTLSLIDRAIAATKR